MKKLLILSILFCLGVSAFAQKVYFIYIQSETSKPFYVKMGDKVYSSTSSGYLILSRLKDSTYSFYLGQPGNQAKELHYSVKLNNNDRGFLLKELQNVWVLFDLQSMSTINPAASTSGVMYQTDVVKTDMFTRLLAQAMDDSTLLLEPVLPNKRSTRQTISKSKAGSATKTPTTEIALKSNTAEESGNLKKPDSSRDVKTVLNDVAVVQPKSGQDSLTLAVPGNTIQSSSPSSTTPQSTTSAQTTPAQTTADSSATIQIQAASGPNATTLADSAKVNKAENAPVQTEIVQFKAQTATAQTKPGETTAHLDASSAKTTSVETTSAEVNSGEKGSAKDSLSLASGVEKLIQSKNEALHAEQVQLEQVQSAPAQSDLAQFKRSIIKRYAESSNTQGFGLTYLDTWEGVTDTIRLIIPNIADPNYWTGAPQPTENKQNVSASKEDQQDTLKVQTAGNGNSTGIDNTPSTGKMLGTDNTLIATSLSENVNPVANSSSSICQGSASDKDVSKLRKAMSAKPRGEEMLAEARKAFDEKCFTTEQVRNLSELFLTSEGKFLFFKDAKSHISDKDRFETLIFEFNDDAYKDRFKALLEN